jgi:hypothetical protein
MKKKGIELTYFPSDYKFPENLKKNLHVFSSNKPKKGAILHNYKILISHF